MSEEMPYHDDEILKAKVVEIPSGTGVIRLPYRLPNGTRSRDKGRSFVHFSLSHLNANQIYHAYFSGQPRNGLGPEGPGPHPTPGITQSPSPEDFQQSSPEV